jgi:hypothetical protein
MLKRWKKKECQGKCCMGERNERGNVEGQGKGGCKLENGGKRCGKVKNGHQV